MCHVQCSAVISLRAFASLSILSDIFWFNGFDSSSHRFNTGSNSTIALARCRLFSIIVCLLVSSLHRGLHGGRVQDHVFRSFFYYYHCIQRSIYVQTMQCIHVESITSSNCDFDVSPFFFLFSSILSVQCRC